MSIDSNHTSDSNEKELCYDFLETVFPIDKDIEKENKIILSLIMPPEMLEELSKLGFFQQETPKGGSSPTYSISPKGERLFKALNELKNLLSGL